jgi:hypothetical protein
LRLFIARVRVINMRKKRGRSKWTMTRRLNLDVLNVANG